MLSIVLICFCFCFILERFFVGWRLPSVRTWPIRVLGINAIQILVVVLAGFTWENWLSHFSLLHLSQSLNPVAGGLVAYFIATFVFYWWHRLRHESDYLWLHFHQIHHSPQRLEVITSFYKHPIEMIVNSVIGSVLVYVVLGLNSEAGAIYTLATALGEFFYHTNVKTPRWVGYFFQRPEMHRIHHKYGAHKNNYGDIVWWDMIFGTYENPKEFTDTCGFDDEKEQQLGAMLLFQDVHKIIGVGIVIGLLLLSPPNSVACSVFGKSMANGQFVVAKNFDWLSNEGFIVENPSQQIKRSFYTTEMTWKSRYRSVSFNTLGPGLPVSGMNEKGLAIETLLDFDSEKIKNPSHRLVSLEWAQYVLDNFKDLSEVIEFAQKEGFDQLIVPVHFFICDINQNCAVFEQRKKRLKITTGLDLKEAVLANRDWQTDYQRSQNSLGQFLRFLSPNSYSSHIRFANLSAHSQSADLRSTQDILEALDSSKIRSMIQWQIIWRPSQNQVSWRIYSNRKPRPTLSLKLFENPEICNDPLIRSLDNPEVTLTYGRSLADETANRVIKIMRKRTGAIDKNLADKIAKHSLHSYSCE